MTKDNPATGERETSQTGSKAARGKWEKPSLVRLRTMDAEAAPHGKTDHSPTTIHLIS